MSSKKNSISYLTHEDNKDTTFIGVFFTLRHKKLPRVFFSFKGSELKPRTGGVTIGEFKNYKALVSKLKLEIAQLKNKYEDLCEDLVTLANAEYTLPGDNTPVPAQDELVAVLDRHGIDYSFEDDDDCDCADCDCDY